jgi:electron transfer flavoprotein alpha subunit
MVLVIAEQQKGQFKKATFEALTFGRKTAEAMGTSCCALVLGQAEYPAELGRYGASRVFTVSDEGLEVFDPQVYTAVIAEVAQRQSAKVIVLNHSSGGRSLLGRLAARFDAASASGVNAVPVYTEKGLQVQKPVFSGKAIATYALKSDISVLTLAGNTLQPEASGADAPVEVLDIPVPASRIKVRSVDRVEGKIPLPEAELVVSAGRGLKGPENWGIVEELAEELGATTACSRPVADVGWRPHHEHVGQTGIAIRPNLYIAIGISGAIQHLAGVNNSKTIVVINKDPEAPFFKAADYGVVGDLFEVVPQLTQAFRRFKQS